MRIFITAAVLAVLIGAGQAADIYVGQYSLGGGSKISIKGIILPGDEQRFARVLATAPPDSAVALDSPGGEIFSAMAIGKIVHERGLITVVGRLGGGCFSACTFIWLAGRHAVVQRDANLGFHAPARAMDGSYSPEATATVVSYLRGLGYTETQARYVVAIPQPGIRYAMETDAAALGLRLQAVSSLLGGWRGCQAKICVAIP